MSKAELQQRVMFRDLPKAEEEQFFMRRLSVYNWGTFSKVHTIRFSDEGALLIGPSGAGKSTLLDAISAMIVPPKKVHFNAAAEEGDRRGHDRTIASYVRGAWADRGDSDSRDVIKQYLRPGAAVAAIALEYGNRLGRTVTLVRIFWITGASTSANVNMHYVVVDGVFDLKALASFDGDLRKLRKQLERIDGVRQHESFGAYQEHWCRVMGIDDPSALDLLHKTQSTKSLGDLNRFLREFMLEEPETFEKADSLVAEFGELDEAHRAVVAAREQIEVLTPAREHFQEHVKIREAMADNESLRAATAAFVQHLKVDLISKDLRRIRTILAAAQGEHATNLPRLAGLQDEITDLQRQHLKAGGADIQAIKARLADFRTQRESRSKAKRKAEGYCVTLDWMLADNAAGFAEQLAEARAIVDDAQAREAVRQERRDTLAIQKHNQESDFQVLRTEIQALEASSSNIPAALQRLRDEMCRALSIPMSQIAFVGELLQVRKENTAEWAPAVERLLGGFGKDLIIDECHHKRVAQWVDGTNLRNKLVYHPVPSGVSRAKREPRTANSIVNKLEIKTHAFSDWLFRELVDRFDYECVATAADLTRGDHRITAEGQIRHSRGRTEKDDRRDLRDRREWVLGFDSREKLEHHRTIAHDLVLAMSKTKRLAEELEAERQQDHARMSAAERLLDNEWDDLDVTSIADRITDQEVRLNGLKVGNSTLSNLDALLVIAKGNLERFQNEQADLRSKIKDSEGRIEKQQALLEQARLEAGALTTKHHEALLTRLPTDWTPTLQTVDGQVQQINDQLQAELMQQVQELAREERAVTTAFDTFMRRWSEESGSLQANLESAPDFFARLKRLEDDGLPEHEGRFRNLLSQQSTQRLAELSRHVTEGRREITLRLDDVNEALYAVPYNHDSYLQINPVDLHLPEVSEFRERLRQIFADQSRQFSEDLVQAEQQFQLLRQLVMDLKADDPEKRRWRERVLDVRQHVEFNAEELERGTDRQIEIYSGSSGKSGGQRQKLTATCLASALRYKLGGVDGGVPQYAAVVLDEAFTKTDDDFTKTCMQVFKELGFQMIVATPIKSVMTLEEFVGGAVFVSINNRHTSAVLAIEYDEGEQRLILSEKQRAQAESEADADA
jgi:uncharacterized protein YPO0396